MSFPSSLRSIEIEQKCSFGFTVDYVESFLSRFSAVKDYAYIVHDKDTRDDGSLKDPHVHLMLRFSYPVQTNNLLAALDGVCGVPQLERVKKWSSAVAYLTHENTPGKHVYDRGEVHSNYDFGEDIDAALASGSVLPRLLESIASGEVRRFDIVDKIGVADFVRYEKQINAAFSYRDLVNFRKVDRSMYVIYLYGCPGSGKTTFAKKLAADRGFSCFVSSGGSDFLDGYAGQDCVILDDFRGSVAPLSVILKLLDNNTASSVPSRYRNKSLSECKLIVITTIHSPRALFNEVFDRSEEPFLQFARRCRLCLEFSPFEIATFVFSGDDYRRIGSAPNVVLDELRSIVPEDPAEYAAHLLGSYGNTLLGLSDVIRSESDILKNAKGGS